MNYFVLLHCFLTIYMKYAGLFLIIMGVLALLVLQLVHFTMINALLLPPFIIIIIGVLLYVWGLKRESLY